MNRRKYRAKTQGQEGHIKVEQFDGYEARWVIYHVFSHKSLIDCLDSRDLKRLFIRKLGLTRDKVPCEIRIEELGKTINVDRFEEILEASDDDFRPEYEVDDYKDDILERSY